MSTDTGLTQAQYKVINLVAKGLQNKEIASRLGVGEVTVKVHIWAAMKRLGLRNRVQLAVWYITKELNEIHNRVVAEEAAVHIQSFKRPPSVTSHER